MADKYEEKWHQEDMDERIHMSQLKDHIDKKYRQFVYIYDDWADCWPSTFPRVMRKEKFLELFFKYLTTCDLSRDSVAEFIHGKKLTDSDESEGSPDEPE